MARTARPTGSARRGWLGLPQIRDGETAAVYTVVFTRAGDHPRLPRWWRLARYFMDGEFTHVWVMRWTQVGWVGLDPGSFWGDVDYLGADPLLPQALVAGGARVLEVARVRDPILRLRGLTTCVTTVKMVLGVRACWVITPRALYHWLLREGHREVGQGQWNENTRKTQENAG